MAETTPAEDDGGLQIVYRNTRDLVPYARNSRTHSKEQIHAIAASIREFGFTNPILVRYEADGAEVADVIAGHARIEAASSLGLEDVPTINLAHLNDNQAKAYIIADNRLAEVGSAWDNTLLGLELADLNEVGYELELTGFSLSDAQELMKAARRTPGQANEQGGQVGEDEFTEANLDNPVTRRGDLWHLGPHRLLCGDSTLDTTMATLIEGDTCHAMLTDPPYAIYGSATGIASDISDDRMVRPFFERIMNIGKDRLEYFAHMYVCCDWRSWPAIWDAARSTPSLEAKNLLIWDKGGAGLGSNYANTYECIGYFSKLPKQTAMGQRPTGQRAVHRPNVLRHNRPHGEDRLHNAAKPVALFRDLMENSTNPGDVILDPFIGSGTTIIAADQAARICLGVDVEPGWCDVTLERFWQLRETEPTLGGVPYSEILTERRG